MVHWKVPRKVVNPAPTMSGPMRLAGRRHQAISPLKMNGTVIQSISAACRPGSLTWSLVRARATEVAAAAQPARARAHRVSGRGA